MQVFQNILGAAVKLLAPFTLISIHMAHLHSERDSVFFPTAVITHYFLPVTHLPSAPIFHIIIFIKSGSKMLLGLVNIARLPSICMLFSLHDSPFLFPWLKQLLLDAIMYLLYFLILTTKLSWESDPPRCYM